MDNKNGTAVTWYEQFFTFDLPEKRMWTLNRSEKVLHLNGSSGFFKNLNSKLKEITMI